MDSSKVINILKENGWVLKSSRGDHHTFKKGGLAGLVTFLIGERISQPVS